MVLWQNAEAEIENVERSVADIDEALKSTLDPLAATDASLTLRGQRPESDNVEDEVRTARYPTSVLMSASFKVQDALTLLKEVLEKDCLERLREVQARIQLLLGSEPVWCRREPSSC